MDKEELKEIRKLFKASRKQFASVFLGGINEMTLYLYETGKQRVPQNIMMLARAWRNFYLSLKE